MDDERKHLCPIRGCREWRNSSEIMCRRHWYMVPEGMRAKIWKLYRRCPGSKVHRTAVFAAIGMVESSELRSTHI